MAKAGILGFSRALALEGKKNNIYVNTIAPNAGTQMTATVLPEEMVKAFKPDYVAPIVVLLCSDQVPEPATGRLFESGSGWAAETRWQRTGGWAFPPGEIFTPEDVISKWDKITNFDDGRADNPATSADSTNKIMENVNRKKEQKSSGGDGKQYLEAIKKAKATQGEAYPFKYDDKDIILYSEFLASASCGYVHEHARLTHDRSWHWRETIGSHAGQREQQ